MTLYLDMTIEDTLRFNFINIDQLTETYSTDMYAEYMAHWPEFQRVAVHPFAGLPMGYMLGKAEGSGEDFHAHVSAVTVAPTFRRLGLGQALMKELEDTALFVHHAYFVDLFVRDSNDIARCMYERLKYIVYRRVLGYYAGGGGGGSGNSLVKANEDALDMRKALERNKLRSKSSVIPIKKPVLIEELVFD